MTLIRLGSGSQTSYTVERGDEEKLTKREIEALLPEKLRDEYDGTMDSLYSIVEDQLRMLAKDYVAEDEEDEDEDDGREGVINVDDEDEEETPKKKSALKKKSSLSNKSSRGKKSLFKKPQNSVKKSAKALLKNK